MHVLDESMASESISSHKLHSEFPPHSQLVDEVNEFSNFVNVHMMLLMLFKALFLELSLGEVHAPYASGWTESTLQFRDRHKKVE